MGRLTPGDWSETGTCQWQCHQYSTTRITGLLQFDAVDGDARRKFGNIGLKGEQPVELLAARNVADHLNEVAPFRRLEPNIVDAHYHPVNDLTNDRAAAVAAVLTQIWLFVSQ